MYVPAHFSVLVYGPKHGLMKQVWEREQEQKQAFARVICLAAPGFLQNKGKTPQNVRKTVVRDPNLLPNGKIYSEMYVPNTPLWTRMVQQQCFQLAQVSYRAEHGLHRIPH